SSASNLVTDDTNWTQGAFVHDRQTFETIQVSVSAEGTESNGSSYSSSISEDGGLVAFGSGSTNLVPNDTNGEFDIFVRDRESVPCSFPASWTKYGSDSPALAMLCFGWRSRIVSLACGPWMAHADPSRRPGTAAVTLSSCRRIVAASEGRQHREDP